MENLILGHLDPKNLEQDFFEKIWDHHVKN